MCPEDGLVILVKAVGVLHRELCLANPTQTANSLGESGSSPLLELSMQLGKQVFAPGEKEVPRERDIPDTGKVGACKTSCKQREIFNGMANTTGDLSAGPQRDASRRFCRDMDIYYGVGDQAHL
jgi:hypothetical protein